MEKIEKLLDEEAQKKLLEIAIAAIENYLKLGKVKKIICKEALLSEKRGVFVTLAKNGKLRGCLGRFEPEGPLYEIVSQMAVAAACEDPRFSPVKEEELKEIDIEISVLSPLRKIKDIKEIKVGRHGIYIVKGFNRGVLLPQVAIEYNWDRDTFLNQTCGKAGLPQEAWKEENTEIYIFNAQIFKEMSD